MIRKSYFEVSKRTSKRTLVAHVTAVLVLIADFLCKMSLQSITLSVFLCVSRISASRYHEYYVEKSCRNGNENIKYVFGHEDDRTAFVLKATQHSHYAPSKNCTIHITLPRSSYRGVTLSITNIEMARGIFDCIDYVQIYAFPNNPVKICKTDSMDVRSFVSIGDMHFLYHTKLQILKKSGFEFTATAYKASPCERKDFHCANGNCIWKNFKCDGRDNCGDNSDETDYSCYSELDYFDKDLRDRDRHWDRNRRNREQTRFPKLIIILCSTGAGFIVLIVIVYCCTKKRKKRQQAASSITNENTSAIVSSAPPYELVHPPLQQPQGVPTIYSPHEFAIGNQNVLHNPYYHPGSEPARPPPYCP